MVSFKFWIFQTLRKTGMLQSTALIMSASLSHPAPTETTMTLAPTPAPLDPTRRTVLSVWSSLSILGHAWVHWLHPASSIVLNLSSPNLVPITSPLTVVDLQATCTQIDKEIDSGNKFFITWPTLVKTCIMQHICHETYELDLTTFQPLTKTRVSTNR